LTRVEDESVRVLKAAAVGTAFASPSVAVIYSASPNLAAVLALALGGAGLLLGVLIFRRGDFLKALGVSAACGGIAALFVFAFSPAMAVPAALTALILGVFLGIVITGPGASFVMGCGLFSMVMMGTGHALGALADNTWVWVSGLFVVSGLLALYMPPLPDFQRALLATLATAAAGIAGAILGFSFGLPGLLALAFMSLAAIISIVLGEEGAVSIGYHSILASVMMGPGFIAAFFVGMAYAWVPLLFTATAVASLFLYRSRTRFLMLLAAPLDILAAFGFVTGAAFRAPMGPVVMAIVLAIDLDILLYFSSDSWILRLNGARIVSEGESPRPYAIARRPAAAANLPVPRIALVRSEAVNLFTVGRSPGRAVIALTQGLLDRLGDDELEAVIAHELAHIKDGDILPMTMACAMATPVGMAMRQLSFGKDRRLSLPSQLGIIAIAPFFALMVHLSMPRAREKRADAVAVQFIKKGGNLASALEKLEKAACGPALDANPASAPLFSINPFGGGPLDGLFNAHPATDERIDQIRHGAAVRRPPGPATPATLAAPGNAPPDRIGSSATRSMPAIPGVPVRPDGGH
jgi:heat shock protein HtpX